MSYFVPTIKTEADFANVVYIDPSAQLNGDGSIENPYNSFPYGYRESTTPNTAYLIKRGTTLTGRIDRMFKHGMIGAYGEGAMPVIDGGIKAWRQSGGNHGSYHFTFRDLKLVSNSTNPISLRDTDYTNHDFVVAYCRIIGLPDENGNYPTTVMSYAENTILFNNEIQGSNGNIMWGAKVPNAKIIRNWIHNGNNRGAPNIAIIGSGTGSQNHFHISNLPDLDRPIRIYRGMDEYGGFLRITARDIDGNMMVVIDDPTVLSSANFSSTGSLIGDVNTDVANSINYLSGEINLTFSNYVMEGEEVIVEFFRGNCNSAPGTCMSFDGDINGGEYDRGFGDGIQWEGTTPLTENLYFAGNYIDRSNSAGKGTIFMNGYHVDNVFEYNTIIAPKRGDGGYAVRWINNGGGGIFSKNVIHSLFDDGRVSNRQGQIPIATFSGQHVETIIDNHTIYTDTEAHSWETLDESNLEFNSNESWSSYINANPEIGLYGSDIDPDTFLTPFDIGGGGSTPEPPYNLTLNIMGNGSVIKNPDKEEYDQDDEVILTAIEEEGWIFSHWGFSLTGNTNPATLVMNSDKTVTAYFNEIHVEPESYVVQSAHGTNNVLLPLPVTTGNLLVAVLAHRQDEQEPDVPDGFTLREVIQNGTNSSTRHGILIADKIADGAETTFDLRFGTSTDIGGIIMEFDIQNPVYFDAFSNTSGSESPETFGEDVPQPDVPHLSVAAAVSRGSSELTNWDNDFTHPLALLSQMGAATRLDMDLDKTEFVSVENTGDEGAIIVASWTLTETPDVTDELQLWEPFTFTPLYGLVNTSTIIDAYNQQWNDIADNLSLLRQIVEILTEAQLTWNNTAITPITFQMRAFEIRDAINNNNTVMFANMDAVYTAVVALHAVPAYDSSAVVLLTTPTQVEFVSAYNLNLGLLIVNTTELYNVLNSYYGY